MNSSASLSSACPHGFVIPDEPGNPRNIFLGSDRCALACRQPVWTDEEYNSFDETVRISAAFAVVASSMVLYEWRSMRRGQRGHRLTIFLVAAVGNSVANMLPYVRARTPVDRFCLNNAVGLRIGDGANICVVRAILYHLSGTMLNVSWASQSLDLYLRYVLGWETGVPDKLDIIFLLGVPLLAVLISSSLGLYGYAGDQPYCFFHSGVQPQHVLFVNTIPGFVIGLIAVYCIVAVALKSLLAFCAVAVKRPPMNLGAGQNQTMTSSRPTATDLRPLVSAIQRDAQLNNPRDADDHRHTHHHNDDGRVTMRPHGGGGAEVVRLPSPEGDKRAQQQQEQVDVEAPPVVDRERDGGTQVAATAASATSAATPPQAIVPALNIASSHGERKERTASVAPGDGPSHQQRRRAARRVSPLPQANNRPHSSAFFRVSRNDEHAIRLELEEMSVTSQTNATVNVMGGGGGGGGAGEAAASGQISARGLAMHSRVIDLIVNRLPNFVATVQDLSTRYSNGMDQLLKDMAISRAALIFTSAYLFVWVVVLYQRLVVALHSKENIQSFKSWVDCAFANFDQTDPDSWYAACGRHPKHRAPFATSIASFAFSAGLGLFVAVPYLIVYHGALVTLYTHTYYRVRYLVNLSLEKIGLRQSSSGFHVSPADAPPLNAILVVPQPDPA